MAVEFKLPDIGEGVAEGEITRWIVKEGDAIKEDEPMVEVMTDKATVEITSPVTGTISKIVHEEGAVVPVHDVIVIIDDGAGGAAPAPAKKEEAPAAAAPASAAAAAQSAPAAAPAAAPVASNGKVLAAPATRKLAREHGVDLGTVPATGPRGRVTREDLQGFLQGGGSAPAAAPAAAAPAAAPAPAAKAPVAALPLRQDFPAGGERHEPYRGIRKATGDQMVRSAYTAPHFTYVEEFDLTELYTLRKRSAELGAEYGVKVTFLPFIIKALCSAIRRFPSVNGELRDRKSVV